MDVKVKDNGVNSTANLATTMVWCWSSLPGYFFQAQHLQATPGAGQQSGGWEQVRAVSLRYIGNLECHQYFNSPLQDSDRNSKIQKYWMLTRCSRQHYSLSSQAWGWVGSTGRSGQQCRAPVNFRSGNNPMMISRGPDKYIIVHPHNGRLYGTKNEERKRQSKEQYL